MIPKTSSLGRARALKHLVLSVQSRGALSPFRTLIKAALSLVAAGLCTTARVGAQIVSLKNSDFTNSSLGVHFYQYSDFVLGATQSPLRAGDGNQGGVFDWSVDAQDKLRRQWFWYRIESGGASNTQKTITTTNSPGTFLAAPVKGKEPKLASPSSGLAPAAAVPRGPELSPNPSHPLRRDGLELTLNCSAGSKYRIEASSDLVHWATITNLTSAGSTIRFRDPTAASHGQRFYRAVPQ